MGNSEIVVIFNQYKDTLDDFINNPDPESLDWARCLDKNFRNILISENILADL